MKTKSLMILATMAMCAGCQSAGTEMNAKSESELILEALIPQRVQKDDGRTPEERAQAAEDKKFVLELLAEQARKEQEKNLLHEGQVLSAYDEVEPIDWNAPHCGNQATGEETEDWTCVDDVLRCLNKDGCTFRDRIAPMRTVLSSSKFYCAGKRFPNSWNNMRCLDMPEANLLVVNDMDNRHHTRACELGGGDGYECNGLICNEGCVCDGGERFAGAMCERGAKLEPRDRYCDDLPPHAVCTDGKATCGGAAFEGKFFKDWRCIDNQWTCIADACECRDVMVGKFGTCRDGKAYCGETEMTALDASIRKGFECKDGRWTCAAPEGCGKCRQTQTYYYGNCEGSVKAESKATFVGCPEGNCACGDGACPKNGTCVTLPDIAPFCTCGELDVNKRVPARSHSVMMSNRYGEFTCGSRYENAESRDEVFCDNPNGCRIAGSDKVEPYLSPEERNMTSELPPILDYLDTMHWEKRDKIYDVNASDYDLKIADLKKEYEAAKAERKQYLKTLDAFEKYLPQMCGPRMTSKVTFLGKANSSRESREDTCRRRKVCDTSAVPASDRSKYVCDFGYDPHSIYMVYENDKEVATIDQVAIGLRCNSPKGCACNRETCPQGALCRDGVCTFDTVYADQVCHNVRRHLAEDEPTFKRDSVIGNPDRMEGGEYGIAEIQIVSPSDAAYAQKGDFAIEETYFNNPYRDADGVLNQSFLWDRYTYDETGRRVAADGTCLCGYSRITPNKLDDFKCIQSLGYVCINAKGCACGSTQCEAGSICLRDGQCSPVVMTSGVNQEKVHFVKYRN